MSIKLKIALIVLAVIIIISAVAVYINFKISHDKVMNRVVQEAQKESTFTKASKTVKPSPEYSVEHSKPKSVEEAEENLKKALENQKKLLEELERGGF